jgi:alkylhydroperoxidase/carboxymuconolactone decarboxylase family protein YurZ
MTLAASVIAATPVLAEKGRDAAPRSPQEVYEASLALGIYTDEVLFGDVWRREGLAPQDRSLVTVAAHRKWPGTRRPAAVSRHVPGSAAASTQPATPL